MLTIQPIGSVLLGAILLGEEPSVLQLLRRGADLGGRDVRGGASGVSLRERLAEGRPVVLDGGLSTALEELGADLNDRLWTARASA